MEYVNTHRSARISPVKARLVVDMIRGRSVSEAEAVLQLCKKRAAVLVRASLDAAVNNADQDSRDPRGLVVTRATVDEGPSLKRFRPKDRGRAHPYKHRTSHITLGVSPGPGAGR